MPNLLVEIFFQPFPPKNIIIVYPESQVRLRSPLVLDTVVLLFPKDQINIVPDYLCYYCSMDLINPLFSPFSFSLTGQSRPKSQGIAVKNKQNTQRRRVCVRGHLT